MDSHFAMPEGLTEDGQRAWKAIVTVLMAEDPRMTTGGCKAFRTPEFHLGVQGEKYGQGSVLIVVYDGGDHRPYFTLDEQCYDLVERMNRALGAIGFHIEECTTWYAAVYKA